VEVVSGSGAIHLLPELLLAMEGPGRAGDAARTVAAFPITTPRGAAQIQELPFSVRATLLSGFSGATAHSPASVIRAATDAAQRARARVLVAFGGGSAVGVAKGVALQTGLPILAVPTTYAGSEFTSIWGWTEAGIKRTGRDVRVMPRVVIQDPELLADLPAATHVRSALNAMAHGVEALYAPGVSPMIALQAEAGVGALARALPVLWGAASQAHGRAASGPEMETVPAPNPWAHAVGEALRGAQLCGVALDQATMGLHHQLAHVLGGGWGLPHASLHAVLLPRVVEFNHPAAPGAMAALSRALGSLLIPDGSEAREAGDVRGTGDRGEAGAAAPAALARLVAKVGVTERLRDLGLPAAALHEATRRVLSAPYPNPRPLTEAGVRGVLEAAW
jgi:maleylacetate reductase